jgi:hypothetical protein
MEKKKVTGNKSTFKKKRSEKELAEATFGCCEKKRSVVVIKSTFFEEKKKVGSR